MTNPSLWEDIDDTISERLATLAGRVSFLDGRLEVIEELVRDGDSSTIPHLLQLLELHESRLKDLESKVRGRIKSSERWVDYDREMKTRFLQMAEDASDWEPWCLIYWFRWLRRSTATKAPVTSWGDYKKQLAKSEQLIEAMGSIGMARDYLEYVVFGPHHQGDLNFHQATSGHYISKLSGQVAEWIEDRVAEQVIGGKK